MAIIVFSHSTWPLNDMPINDNWINYRPIKFVDNASKRWDLFLTEQKMKSRYCNIENELEKYIRQLDKLWVVQQNADLNYSLEKCIET
jgi:hypothetical protein